MVSFLFLGLLVFGFFTSGSCVNLSLSLYTHCILSLFVDGVQFALLKLLPSPPSLALLTNSRSPAHVDPSLLIEISLS